MPPMRLGTMEEWVVRVQDETTAGPSLIHPFHIHVNPFFVTHHNGVPLPQGHPRRRWQDTIAIPPQGSITFRTRFDNFAGDFVIHCHNLRHEDRGMMHKVRVVDDAEADSTEVESEESAAAGHSHQH
jgi:FtsP/CotA-like multicopper oxidase with cupredoxin domain